MLWCKYVPNTLDEYGFNHKIISQLKTFIQNIKETGNLPNIGFYGISSSGKLTLARCFLASIYGKEIFNLVESNVTTKQNCTNYNIKILKSPFHYEISLCGLQYADKSVLVNIIDTYFSTTDVITHKYKILIIKDFEILTEPAQFALRRKLETHISTFRLITIMKSINKIERAILSRLVLIRCRRPNNNEMMGFIDDIAKRESIPLRTKIKQKICNLASGDLGVMKHHLNILKNEPNAVLINPNNTIINNLLKCLHKKNYTCGDIRKYISDIQLSKINMDEVFMHLFQESKKIISEKDYAKSIDMCSKCQQDAYNTKKYPICLEKYIIYIFTMKIK